MSEVLITIAGILFACLVVTLIILLVSCQRDDGKLTEEQEKEFHNKLDKKPGL